MTNKIIIVAILILLSSFAFAQEPDLNTMSAEELQEYVQQLITENQQPAVMQPTVITIQADQQLNDKLDLLTSEVGSMKAEMTQMQDRFNRLATETETKIDQGATKGTADTTTITQKQIDAFRILTFDYIDQRTNPVRQNAPAIGVFLILTGAFLLWAGRQYKMTGGQRSVELPAKPGVEPTTFVVPKKEEKIIKKIEQDRIKELEDQLANYEKMSVAMLEKQKALEQQQENMKKGLKTIFEGGV